MTDVSRLATALMRLLVRLCGVSPALFDAQVARWERLTPDERDVEMTRDLERILAARRSGKP